MADKLATMQIQSNVNVNCQTWKKFDREEKSQSVQRDLNLHHCRCWQLLFCLFYRQTLETNPANVRNPAHYLPAPPTLTLLTIYNPAPPIHTVHVWTNPRD